MRRASSIIHFDQNLLVLDQKSNRHLDYKRHVNAALGISPDESPSSSAKEKLLPCLIPEDVKRMRDSLYLSTVKAREHVKMFDEALSVFNVKKRSQVEGFSSDRSSVMLNDRSISGPSMDALLATFSVIVLSQGNSLAVRQTCCVQ